MSGGAESDREPTSDVLRRLAGDLAGLARLYGRTARGHGSAMARDAGIAALMVGAALVLGVFALGLTVATLVLVLAIWIPAWQAALIALGAIAAVMAVLVIVATRRLSKRRRAWATMVQEEVQWLRSLFPKES